VVSVIINPISGGARASEAAERVALSRTALSGLAEATAVSVSQRRGHIRELAVSAVAQGARLVIVWGGDGTVNEAGSALLGTPTCLAMIPSGSGNGLARELGVPSSPRPAFAAALAAAPRTIDAGEIGERPFFNIAGIGFDAHVAARFDRSNRRGLASYVSVSARELLTYRSSTYRIATGEQVSGVDPTGSARHALLVTIANSPQFGNGARIAPLARLDDGRLDLVVYEERSRWTTVCSLPRLFAGGIERLRGVSMQQIERARIESDLPMIFHVDGEPIEGGAALDVRVLPAALRVAAPVLTRA
jgi:diacylglycerol kinase family enzyme